MSRLQEEVRAVVARDGVIARREHPSLRGSVDVLVKTGRLRPVLPGVYAPPDLADTFEVRVAALTRWSADAVMTHEAAARTTFWPRLPVSAVSAAVSRRASHRGFRFQTRRIPPELVVERNGFRMTSPALTVLDLCDNGTEAIDQVLRSREATLDDLWEAFELTRGRRGNAERLRHLIDSRDEPWSAAERLCHRLLRDAGIGGWESNLHVRSGGRFFYVDVAFAALGVAVEIDGRDHETDPDIFENDRWRQNSLVLDGWIVVRFTWAMLTQHPDVVVATVVAALAAAHNGRPTTFRHSIVGRRRTRAQRRLGPRPSAEIPSIGARRRLRAGP